MGHGHRVSCVLCQRSVETKITGPLSTKDDVTAHQNCLLFSSGICCQNSPLGDDLFGFSVEDVRNEVKRGRQLKCCRCKKNGATAGCEVRRCKKTFHYPCAVEESAQTVEKTLEGKYELYCRRHHEMQIAENNGFANGCTSSLTKTKTSKNPSEAGPSEVHCLVCEKTEGNIRLQSLSNGIIMFYCDKHAPSSHKRDTSGDSPRAGPSMYNSKPSSSVQHLHLKRQLSPVDSDEDIPFKHKSKRRSWELSSDSDDNQPYSETFAPIEFDFDESVSTSSDSLTRKDNFESHPGSTPGNHLEDEGHSGNEDDEDETILHSDAESESLLLPVEICMESQSQSVTTAELYTQTESAVMKIIKSEDKGSSPEPSSVHSPDPQTAEPAVPQQSSAPPLPSADCVEPRSDAGSPPCTGSANSPATPEPCVPLVSSPTSSKALPSDSKPSVDSASFWKSCNTAGCTQAIFNGFINDIYDICGRIQSDRASKEDYDRALAVMKASGKLAELVTAQQEELQRKQMELEKAATAMTEVVSALKR